MMRAYWASEVHGHSGEENKESRKFRERPNMRPALAAAVLWLWSILRKYSTIKGGHCHQRQKDDYSPKHTSVGCPANDDIFSMGQSHVQLSGANGVVDKYTTSHSDEKTNDS
jgi:hypothetical protein